MFCLMIPEAILIDLRRLGSETVRCVGRSIHLQRNLNHQTFLVLFSRDQAPYHITRMWVSFDQIEAAFPVILAPDVVVDPAELVGLECGSDAGEGPPLRGDELVLGQEIVRLTSELDELALPREIWLVDHLVPFFLFFSRRFVTILVMVVLKSSSTPGKHRNMEASTVVIISLLLHYLSMGAYTPHNIPSGY